MIMIIPVLSLIQSILDKSRGVKYVIITLVKSVTTWKQKEPVDILNAFRVSKRSNSKSRMSFNNV